MVANIGQILKDLEFPADKNKIISFVENNASVGTQREEIISALKIRLNGLIRCKYNKRNT